MNLERVRQKSIRHDFADKPSRKKSTSALLKLKNGRTRGSSGILLDMEKASCGNESFMYYFMDLIHTVWDEG